jgi:mannose-6-phosphate isomerase
MPGIIPGMKVDLGAKECAGHPGEKSPTWGIQSCDGEHPESDEVSRMKSSRNGSKAPQSKPGVKDRSVDDRVPLYPLRFDPIYQYRLWGGRRLAGLLTAPLPGDGPIGEAWVLSDRDDHRSLVANGPLKGQSIAQLLGHSPAELLGDPAPRFRRFPLLLKFLDAREMLSVQVHPGDTDEALLPAGETGKTEAWVVLETGPESRIYAGLKPGTTMRDLRKALADGTVADRLACFTPKPGDGVFLPAGTVHALGGDIVVFEVQENSDVTFRLYDWDHVDANTGQARALQVEQALACIDLAEHDAGPVAAVVELTAPMRRERLFQCKHFGLWRLSGQSLFAVGAPGALRVIVCIDGEGQVEHKGSTYPVAKGDVWLLPAVVGACPFQPCGTVTLLEIALPVAGL